MKKSRRRDGFTLMEVMVVLFILILLSGVVRSELDDYRRLIPDFDRKLQEEAEAWRSKRS